MKYILLALTIAAASLNAMHQNDDVLAFYKAIQEQDSRQAVALLQNKKALANANFIELCKTAHDETGENDTPLLSTIRDKRYSRVIFKALLTAGADIDAPGHDGLTPLLKSILFLRVDIARKLLKRNANTYPRIHIFQGGTMDALELAENMQLKELAAEIKQKREDLAKALTNAPLEAIQVS